MDFSNEYVKMCEMATELREMRFPAGHLADGDFIAFRVKSNGNETVVAICEEDTVQLHNDVCAGNVEYWWLPRPDQIQKILIENVFRDDIIPLYHIRELYEWLVMECGHNHAHGIVFNTMEKVWLAFVMTKLYSKTWKGDRWS